MNFEELGKNSYLRIRNIKSNIQTYLLTVNDEDEELEILVIIFSFSVLVCKKKNSLLSDGLKKCRILFEGFTKGSIRFMWWGMLDRGFI